MDRSRRQLLRFGAATTLVGGLCSSQTGQCAASKWDLAYGRLVDRTHTLLVSVSQEATTLAPFLAEWPVDGEHREVVPASLPVLRWLSRVRSNASSLTLELVDNLCRAAGQLAWRQTYTAAEVGAAFLENYGWSEIVGLSGGLASERIACGFLLLGPATVYPRHRHEAEEIYIPLAGTASWQQGDGPWQVRAPGTVIHHASDVPHAMRTGADALLALYLWRTANLRQKAHLD
jgi:hypothetical protein